MKFTDLEWEADNEFVVAKTPEGPHEDIYLAQIVNEDEENRLEPDPDRQLGNARLMTAARELRQALSALHQAVLRTDISSDRGSPERDTTMQWAARLLAELESPDAKPRVGQQFAAKHRDIYEAKARELYVGDDIMIDSQPRMSAAVAGCWVQGWLWVSESAVSVAVEECERSRRGVESAHCGDVILEESAVTSSRHGSVHNGCAEEREQPDHDVETDDIRLVAYRGAMKEFTGPEFGDVYHLEPGHSVPGIDEGWAVYFVDMDDDTEELLAVVTTRTAAEAFVRIHSQDPAADGERNDDAPSHKTDR